MKKKVLFLVLAAIFFVAAAFFVGCNNGSDDNGGDNPPSITDPDDPGTDPDDPGTDPDDPGTDPDDPGTDPGEEEDEDLGDDVDLVLFIGQSNMAGRGTASEATVVGEGHAYEFRAISDPTKLYPVEEPFGVNENNPESGVSESKKTGSMVSAICESYYQATQTPIVAVSCAQGATGINFWDINRPAYADACERMLAAKEYLLEDDDFALRNTYVVWLQGEHDGGNAVTAERYTKKLTNIFDGFKADIDADHCFVIPIGSITNEDLQDGYTVIREAQMDFCDSYADATVASIQLMDMFDLGWMKDNVHYSQRAYNLVGADVGSNMGYYTMTGEEAVCEHYEYEVELPEYTKGAAYIANADGDVVIPAGAAFENSPYASATSRYNNNDTLYYWTAVDTYGGGLKVEPNNGATWNTGTGYERAPQLNFSFYVDKPGTYYLYMLTSFPDTESNSIMTCIDGGTLAEWAMSSYGNEGRWYGGTSGVWFEIAEPGIHTLTVCAREDGVVLHQFVLSQDSSKSYVTGAGGGEPQAESGRMPIEEKGAYVEVNGSVSIDMVSALENSDTCSYQDKEYNGVEYYWQRSGNGSGVQIMPQGGIWAEETDLTKIPQVSYKVYFTTPGTYYVYMYTTFLNASSDSAMIGVDGDTPLQLNLMPNAVGRSRWLTDEGWTIDIPTAGEHTITIYARESATAMHKLFLSTSDSKIVGVDPAPSPRVSLGEAPATVAEQGGIAFAEGNAATYQFSFATAGTYSIYARVDAEAGSSVAFGSNAAVSFGAAQDAWADFGTLTVASAGDITLNRTVTGSAEVVWLYLISEDVENETVDTLVFGDSYTSLTYWRQFKDQMAVVNGITIGVSGTEVDEWVGRTGEIATLYAPKNIVIHIGVNDINRGESGTDCGNAIVGMIEDLQERLPNTNIFYVSICDNNSHANDGKWAQYAASNEIVKELADESADDTIYYIDFNSAMDEVRENGSMNNNGFSGDNLHLSTEGYELFSSMIIEAIQSASNKVTAEVN